MKDENEKKKINQNDPIFTAKALGELLDTHEDIEIDPSSLNEFNSLKGFTQVLSQELKSEAESDCLNPDQLKEIDDESDNEKDSKLLRFPAWGTSLAACLAIGGFSFLVLKDQKPENLEVPALRKVSVVESSPSFDTKNDTANVSHYLNASKEIIDPNKGRTRAFELEAEKPEIDLALEESESVREFRTQPMVADTLANQGLDLEKLEVASSGASDIYLSDLDSPVGAVTPTQAKTLANNAKLSYGSRRATANESEVLVVGKVSADDFEVAEPRLPASAFSKSPAASLKKASLVSRSQANEKVTSQSLHQFNYSENEEKANREGYNEIVENEFRSPLGDPLSTFSIDVDTAAYSNVRRYLNNGELPPADAVRVEEFINYFSYDYREPEGTHPFSVSLASAKAPWNEGRQLVRIALKGKDIAIADRKSANLVFLIDVSGSMSNANKLPLAKKALKRLVDRMGNNDRIAVVVYAGASGLALPSTTANNRETIKHAIDNLNSGGSTNGGAGIELAYDVAKKHFIDGGINRVILCTDGDFNVGSTSQGGLADLIEEKRESGIFFSALGFGQGNYRDDMMETLSNKGNGNYAYIDSDKEARKVFGLALLGSLQTIAKDVKIQVEFNPSKVHAYRLVGYENRTLNNVDFNNDKKDAGEIGANHRVTAFYEIVPVGESMDLPAVDPLKYQTNSNVQGDRVDSDEILTVKLRYKLPSENRSTFLSTVLDDPEKSFEGADLDFRFASAVAAFALKLRGAEDFQSMSYSDIEEIALASLGADHFAYRADFLELVRKADALTP